VSAFVYSLNTSTIRPTPLLDKIRIAGMVGYRGIELWNDEVRAFLEQGGSLDDLRHALRDNGLTVVGMIALKGWITAEGTDSVPVLDDCRLRMEQAVALGSPYIVVTPPREIVNLEKASQRYGELLRIGRELGVVPAMEFLGFVEGIRTLAAAWAVAAGTGAPEACVVADVFHLLRGGGTVDDVLAISGDRLAIFHINDVPAVPPVGEQTDADRVMVGDGIANLPRLLAHLNTIGYRGPLSLELFHPGLWNEDPAEVARRGLDRIRTLVEG
jgi:sugar phosphate isomerase/epimerase